MSNNKMMVRDFAGIEFQQERVTCMINITPLFENATQLVDMFNVKANTPIGGLTLHNEISRLDNYFKQTKTKELLNRLAEVDNLKPKEVKRASRAKGAVGTFVHPVVFVDAMSWLSVDFKIWANKLVMDELIKYRNMSAKSNLKINKAFDEAGLIREPGFDYGKINRAIGDTCEVDFIEKSVNREYKWGHATKKQLQHREQIQNSVSDMIKIGLISNFGAGIAAIKALRN